MNNLALTAAVDFVNNLKTFCAVDGMWNHAWPVASKWSIIYESVIKIIHTCNSSLGKVEWLKWILIITDPS